MSSKAKEMLKNFRRTKTIRSSMSKDMKEMNNLYLTEEKNDKDNDPLYFLERHSIKVEPGSVEEFLYGHNTPKRMNIEKISKTEIKMINEKIIEEPMNIKRNLNDSFDSSDMENKFSATRASTFETFNPIVSAFIEEEPIKERSKKLFRDKKSFSHTKFENEEVIYSTIDELSRKTSAAMKSSIAKVLNKISLPQKCIFDRDAKIISDNDTVHRKIQKLTDSDIIKLMTN